MNPHDHDPRFSNDPKEAEANLFALCLLMPEYDFLYVWRSRGGDKKRIGAYFGVGVEHVIARLESLEIPPNLKP